MRRRRRGRLNRLGNIRNTRRHGDLRQQAMAFWVARSRRKKRWLVSYSLIRRYVWPTSKTERYPIGGPATWPDWRRGCEKPACLSDEVIVAMSLPGPKR